MIRGTPVFALLAVVACIGGCGESTQPAGEDSTPFVPELVYAAVPPPNGLSDLWFSRGDGMRAVQVTADAFTNIAPQWSPDGNTVAFYTVYPDSTCIDMISADGRTRWRVVTGLRNSFEPSWSPDGQSLVFTGGDDYYAPTLYIANRDGTGAHKVPSGGDRDHQPAWSPDGATIAFTSVRVEDPPHSGSFGGGLFLINTDGTQLRQLIPEQHLSPHHPAWSPDGTRLVFQGLDDIYLLTLATNTVVRLTTTTSLETDPSWLAHGSRIAFTKSAPGSASAVFTMKPDGSDVRQITRTFAALTPHYRPLP